MTDIPARELRNDVSSVLRRVEKGEVLRVTISGRAVAELVPLSKRPRTMTWDALMERSHEWQADPALKRELMELFPDTTDDVPDR